MWVVVGVVVIGGGVFAGFQIRAMRLRSQIAEARDQAVDLAKSDTWRGWTGAQERLAGIAGASATVENRAALARSRAVLAYEFGDGLAEAKAAVDALDPDSGLDGALATTYVALARHDLKAATASVARVTALSPEGAASQYVAGQAALLAGNHVDGIAGLRRAYEREPRPSYAVGLARALSAVGEYDKAIEAIDRVLVEIPKHPAALIQLGAILGASGRIVAGASQSVDIRNHLAAIIAEGKKALAEQERGVSPAQVAFADLALARIDFATGDSAGMRSGIGDAVAQRIDEQRFAEQAVDTLYAIGDLQGARVAIDRALAVWPTSRPVLIMQAQLAIAGGRPVEAIEILKRAPDAAGVPSGLAVRGIAKLELGDVGGAQADLDAALKVLPSLPAAIIGRSWLDLANGDPGSAVKRLEPRYKSSSGDVALATAYAAALRSQGDPSGRERAKQVLDAVLTRPTGYTVARAQQELGRLLVDRGEFPAARSAFDTAARGGALDARIDLALLQIEDRETMAGSKALTQLLNEAGDRATAALMLETARAQLLAGAHTNATQLLDRADRTPNVVRWRYDRELGRVALRKGDFGRAAEALTRALGACKRDGETFLLAADVVSSDVRQASLATRLRELVTTRLQGVPEGMIVTGKLALGDYNAASNQNAPELAAKALEDAANAYQGARRALTEANATPRRFAQVELGLAVIAYHRRDDATARRQLGTVIQKDPSLYDAYLFLAELAGPKNTNRALQLAQQATTYNPDLVAGWVMVGNLAAKSKNQKLLQEAIARLSQLAPEIPELAALKKLRR